MRYVILGMAVLSLLLCGCSDDESPTQPTLTPGQGTLLVSRLVVSVVPGGEETVAICATDAKGARSSCTISNSSPSVATVTLNDSTLEVTGVNYGITNVTITNSSGKQCVLPVQVYNHRVLDLGELRVTYTDSFAAAYSVPIGFWRPVPPAGFFALGTYIKLDGNGNPNGVNAVMVVAANPGSNSVAFTKSFMKLEDYWGSNYKNAYQPVAPVGYKAMGFVYSMTAPDSIACIREDLTIPGKVGRNLQQSGNAGTWPIEQPDAGCHDGAYLAPGTFLLVSGTTTPPTTHALLNVLKVDLPMLAEAPAQLFTPRLTGYTNPPDMTSPTMAKAMLAPCSIVNDISHSGDIVWQVANSPFYRLERQVYYKLIYHNHNQTTAVQTNSVTIRSGITTTQTDKVYGETSVAVSAEVGISYKAVSGKITATVSKKFGYETQSAVAALQEKEVSTSVNTPAGKAAALWQQYNRYVLYRHNGTQLEPVTSWEFGIDSYVTDQYPD